MKKILQFRSNFTLVVLFFLAASYTAEAQEQIPAPKDPIRLFDGIPVMGGLIWDWIENEQGQPGNPGAVDSMINHAGVGIIDFNVEMSRQMDTLAGNYGFIVMPFRTVEYNYVQHYTNAKYSVWEAEGTPLGKGVASLIRNESKTEIRYDGDTTYIRRLSNVTNSIDTLIMGPYQWQDVRYYASQDGSCDNVPYTAEFRLKIEPNNPVEDNPEDTICVIQVTQGHPHFTCTFVIAERIITLGEFNLNQFKSFSLEDYELTSDSCQGEAPGGQVPFYSRSPYQQQCPGVISMRENIQYKVIWMGKSNSLGYPAYLLSVDKVTLSDVRGREMFVTQPAQTQALIESQAAALSQHHGSIAGYVGIDEPRSLDLYEPMKKVRDILDSYTQRERPLWLYFAGADEYHTEEFKQRIGKGNIIYNTFMFEQPCRPDINCEALCPDGAGDYRDKNIRVHVANIKNAFEMDPNFGLTLQTGASKPPYGECAEMRNIARHEMLYNANLGLMLGAKFFNLYTYLAQSPTSDTESGFTYHAVVDWEPNIQSTIYTDKFYMMRDTLSPRLKGLFGKTIKKLKPVEQFLGVDALSASTIPYDYFDYVELLTPPGGDTCLIDLGFFEDPQDLSIKYFMPLNRYYSNRNSLKFGLKSLTGFSNWNISNFVNLTNMTVVPNNGKISFNDIIVPGDANLYSVAPVVKVGGVLVSNDTIKTGSVVLTDNMTIQNGVNLIINTSYTANDTITLEGTGFITGDGFFYLSGNGETVINDWSRSLFRSSQGDHPKVIWGKYPGTGVESFEVYRKLHTFNWTKIADLGPSARFYIDSSQMLPNTPYVWDADYKVKMILERSEPYYSNTVHFEVNNPFVGKEEARVKVFTLTIYLRTTQIHSTHQL